MFLRCFFVDVASWTLSTATVRLIAFFMASECMYAISTPACLTQSSGKPPFGVGPSWDWPMSTDPLVNSPQGSSNSLNPGVASSLFPSPPPAVETPTLSQDASTEATTFPQAFDSLSASTSDTPIREGPDEKRQKTSGTLPKALRACNVCKKASMFFAL